MTKNDSISTYPPPPPPPKGMGRRPYGDGNNIPITVPPIYSATWVSTFVDIFLCILWNIFRIIVLTFIGGFYAFLGIGFAGLIGLFLAVPVAILYLFNGENPLDAQYILGAFGAIGGIIGFVGAFIANWDLDF